MLIGVEERGKDESEDGYDGWDNPLAHPLVIVSNHNLLK